MSNGSSNNGGGKLILKGIMDVEDALLAVKSGADAIVVSNHGGRQLDGAPSSIAALPAIVITGSSLGGHEDEALRHDFHLLIKPVLPGKLRAMIAFKLALR